MPPGREVSSQHRPPKAVAGKKFEDFITTEQRGLGYN
jgi:hypothetical protein